MVYIQRMIEINHPFSYIIGLDNGVSSNGIALLGPDNLIKYEKLPIRKEINYQKAEQGITRIDVPGLRLLLTNWNLPKNETVVVMERPMVNPTRFKASISAVRCLEAELIVIEEFGFSNIFVDSKNWQSVLLPGIEGSEELKKASLELGKKMFPQFKLKRDSDPLLIAYYWKNKAALTTIKPKTKKSL
jgi:hypothetical protein